MKVITLRISSSCSYLRSKLLIQMAKMNKNGKYFRKED